MMREDLAADLGEFGIGCKVREVYLDAHDLIHVGVELAQGLADAVEGDVHFLLEADGLVVQWDRHAHLTRDEDPAAGFGIDTQRLAEALRDRAGEMSHCAHDGTHSCMSGLDDGVSPLSNQGGHQPICVIVKALPGLDPMLSMRGTPATDDAGPFSSPR